MHMMDQDEIVQVTNHTVYLMSLKSLPLSLFGS
jgi:hypothetical protein